MIILADNKNYAIRLCKESETEHFIETEGAPETVFGAMRLLSDICFTVVVSGTEAEEYLDENNIFYVHIETIKKENFERWTKRLSKLIEEEQELIEATNTSEKLIFALTEDMERGTFKTNNILEVTRDLKTDEYFVTLNLEGYSTCTQIVILDECIKAMEDNFGVAGFGVDDGDFYNDINFSSGKSILEIICKMKMFRAILKASRE